jgi:CheY-like chemotaxis protein
MSGTEPRICGGVLIVDDDEGIRDALSQVLSDEGYRVLSAENGIAALTILRSADPRPCMILLDMMMPVMDGREFIARKMAEPNLRDVPVVVVTADGRALKGSSELTAAAVLAKPISLDQLLLAVQRFCA